MLPSYFDYIFGNLRQKVRVRPELSPKFFSTLGPNPTRIDRPDLQLWAKQNLLNKLAQFNLGENDQLRSQFFSIV